MATDKVRLVQVDSKGRVVLPKEVRKSEFYAVELRGNSEIVLRPRIAVDPNDVISKKSLSVLDESMQNLTMGKAGNPIDLSEFREEDETGEQKVTVKQKKIRAR